MKRIASLIIVLAFFSCQTNTIGHVDAVEKFIEGFISNDISAVEKVSTETTVAMVKQLIENQKLHDKPFVLGEIAGIASRKSGVQSEIVISKDSVSQDGSKAWVWFKLHEADRVLTEEMIIPLTKNGTRWLVDIPVIVMNGF